MDRRQFLKSAAGGALAASGLYGCGGGGGSGGGGGGGGSITEAERGASMDAILDFVQRLPGGLWETRTSSIFDFVSNRPELTAVGRNPDGVWLIYPDGFPLMIQPYRRRRDRAARSPAPLPSRAAGTNVPARRPARIINTAPGFDEAAWVAPLLSANGYQPNRESGMVGDLMNVTGDGVFHLCAPAGWYEFPLRDQNGNIIRDPASGRPRTQSIFSVHTEHPYVSGLTSPYMMDIRASRIGVKVAAVDLDANGNPVYGKVYVITPAFVRSYIHFNTNSLVWLSVPMSSPSAYGGDFVQACVDQGAGLVVHWSGDLTDGASLVAGRFILDRLLGLNATNPRETPPQRAFDYVQVWGDLKIHGLDSHPVVDDDDGRTYITEIEYTVGRGSFGLLAPSIQYMLINEVEDRVHPFGTFGNPAAGERVVLIGGQPTGIINWKENEIICELERSGTGSSGDVQVIVREHKSNIRRITEWNVPMTYQFWNRRDSPLKVTGQVFVRFRADVGDFRTVPHDAPIRPVRAALATRDSDADLTASGQVDLSGCTYSWSGHQVFPAYLFNGAPNRVLISRFKVDVATMKGAIGLDLASFAPHPFTQRIDCPNELPLDSDFTVSLGKLYGEHMFPDPGEDPNRPDVPLHAIEIDFGPGFRIPAGSVEDLETGLMRLEWTAVNPTPGTEPDPQAARSAPVKNDPPPIYKVIGKRTP